nr:MAG TPA: stabilization protein [Bacteriophage sp.]
MPIVNIVKENYDFNTNIKKVQLESLGRINLKDKYIPNNTNGTYANPCISYGLKSLRRDELYRFAIVLYNSKGESSSALWIDDIRTPSINDPGFETFCANGQHYNDDGNLEDDNTELTVYPLGIQFRVDIDLFN